MIFPNECKVQVNDLYFIWGIVCLNGLIWKFSNYILEKWQIENMDALGFIKKDNDNASDE